MTKTNSDFFSRFAYLLDGSARDSLLNLALIQDGHPTHTNSDDLAKGTPRPNKAKDIQDQMGIFRAKLEDAVNGATPAERRIAANDAANAIEGVILFLAAYNFDTARRFAIMHFSLTPITKHGKATSMPAELVDQDNKAINDKDVAKNNATFLGEWKKRAERAWTRLDAWHDRIKKPAQEYLSKSL